MKPEDNSVNYNNMTNGCSSRRQTARSAIEDRILRLRREADGLGALLNALPADLLAVSQEADSVLWHLVTKG